MGNSSHSQPTKIEDLFTSSMVLDVYNNQPNYKIVEEDKEGDLCAIYFSSNGLYTQNTEEEFTRVILEKNRFEWQNNRIEKAKKHIFLRDVFKSAYATGINSKINSMHKIIEFLKEETKGYKVVTLGSSSGGYAAFVTGVKLNADYIFSFTGQFNIYNFTLQHVYDFKRQSPFYKFKDDPEYNQYYNLLETDGKTCNIPVFYFTSTQRLDVLQKNLVQTYDNIFTFDMKSDDHRLPVYVFNFKDILNMDKNKLIRLGYKYSFKKISRFRLSVEVTGFKKTIKELIKGYIKSKKKSKDLFK